MNTFYIVIKLLNHSNMRTGWIIINIAILLSNTKKSRDSKIRGKKIERNVTSWNHE